MILQTFFDTGLNTVPEALSPKDSGYLYLLGGVLFISFLFLALVKRSNHRVFELLVRLFFNPSNIDQRMKDGLRLTSFASLMLLVNYLVIFSVCSFLLFDFIQVLPSWVNSWITFIVPLFLLMIQIGFVLLVNWISGANLPMGSIIGNTLIVLELTGVLLSVLALFWVLNPEYSFQAAVVFLSLFGIAQILRVFKNSFTVLNSGVGWYYILLYFCTLEILPLFVAYYYVQLNFLK
jgi:hypothetical protein